MDKPVIKGMTVNGYPLILQDGGKEIERVCPKCHQKKPLKDFGLRCMGGQKQEIRNQSECSLCRNPKGVGKQ